MTLTCNAQWADLHPWSDPAIAEAAFGKPARGLGSKELRDLARPRSGIGAQRESAVLPSERKRGLRTEAVEAPEVSALNRGFSGTHTAGSSPEGPWVFRGTHMEELKMPHCPVLCHLLTNQRHLQLAMSAGLGIQGPVMLTLHLGGRQGQLAKSRALFVCLFGVRPG